VSLSRWIGRNRPEILLFLLIGLSLLSLIQGTEAGIIRTFIRNAVSVTAYPFVQVMNGFEDATTYALDFVFYYDALRDDNAALREQLAAMKLAINAKQELAAENERLRSKLNYEYDQPRLELRPVRVIESFKGTLKIDHGSLHGMRDALCVITPEGVVGIIIETGPFTSVVATLHHPDCRVGAMVKRNRLRAYDGIIHASGSDLSRICTMEYIDLKDDVRTGDLVVTSPESLFPSGYPIGTVTAVHGTGTLWRTAEIAPSVDPYTLDEVFVVLAYSSATEDMEGPPPEVEPEMIPEVEPPRPQDMRTIQERFAP
jgi:rod shape-determining protein MreC